jgi:hypothetical protein
MEKTFSVNFRTLCVALLFSLIFFIPFNTSAEDVILTWDPNTEHALAGYSIYGSIEFSDGPYDHVDSFSLDEIDPENPKCKITGLENKVSYYFVVTAFDTKGNESKPSHKICVKDGHPCSPRVLDLTPKDTIIPRGGKLTIDATIKNPTGEAQTVYVGTNVTKPNGDKFPLAGYLDGPYKITLNPFEKKYAQISYTVPIDWPLGNFSYHGYVGSLKGDIIEECSFVAEVVEAVKK